MAASDHLQNHQLSMFLPARELMNYTAGHTEGINKDYLPLSKSPGVIREKLQESKTGSAATTFAEKKRGKPSLYQSIKKEGVTNPVVLHLQDENNPNPTGAKGTQIWDGHHRIAAAHDIDPNMEIPVRYY